MAMENALTFLDLTGNMTQFTNVTELSRFYKNSTINCRNFKIDVSCRKTMNEFQKFQQNLYKTAKYFLPSTAP